MFDIFNRIKEITGESYLKRDEPMKFHTTFKTGGNADIFVEPETEEQLFEIIKLCKKERQEYFILGRGSDLLISDKGYRGVIVSTTKIDYIELISEDVIEAGVGATVSEVSKFALDNLLTGMEFASGIPGSMGGAVYMNAGAYGGESKDIILEVKVIEDDNIVRWVGVSDLDLGYRYSNIAKLNRVAVAVRLKLSKGNKEKVQLILVMSRDADLYLLDEPIAGVDPVAREYILDTIIKNYNRKGTIVISTHLIADVERVLDEVIFINKGDILLHESAEHIKSAHNKSIDEYFREVFK